MRVLSELFYNLYAKTIVLLAFLLIELILVIRYLKSDSRSITTTQFLKFIEDQNPTICYTRRVKRAEEVECCRVCLSELEEGEKVRNLKCKHTFHKDCLDQWLQQCLATCPLCRSKVLSDDVVAQYHHHRLRNLEEFDDGNDEPFMVLLSVFRGGSTLRRYL